MKKELGAITPNTKVVIKRKRKKKIKNDHLSTYERFKQLYADKLENKMVAITKERNKIFSKIFILILLIIIPTLSATIFSSERVIHGNGLFPILAIPYFVFINLGLSNSFALGGTFILYGIIIYNVYKIFRHYKDYQRKYKATIVKPIIEVINSNLTYQPKGYIPEPYYNRSKLFSQHNRYKGDDLIEGEIDGMNVSMSELHSAYETGHGKNKRVTPIFDGLFFIFDYKKGTTFETFIYPDFAERTFGKLFGQKLQSMFTSSSVGKIVKLEDPEFEKLYKVFATDQIEARTILTPVMMKKMVQFLKKLKKQPLYFSFQDDKVYMAISYAKRKGKISSALFEPPSVFSVGKRATFNHLKEVYDLIYAPLEIAKSINENAKLWKKV